MRVGRLVRCEKHVVRHEKAFNQCGHFFLLTLRRCRRVAVQTLCPCRGEVVARHVHAQERSCVTLFSWQRQFALLASFNTRVTRRAAVFVGRVVVTVSVTPFVVGRMKYIFEVSEPHVVEQLAANCNQILYTAYEAIFETSLLDAARRQLHCSSATGGLGVRNFAQDAPTLPMAQKEKSCHTRASEKNFLL
jgi:hypothetical protein